MSNQGDGLAGAARRLEAALAEDPENAMLRARLGAARLAMGDHAAGIAALREAAALDARSALLRNELGVALAATGAVAEAERTMRKALMLDPEMPEIHNNYGNILRQAGDPAKAAACYQAALRRRPDYTQARVNLGVVLLESGQPERAIECFDMVLSARPEDATAWSHKAAALTSLGRFMEAETACRRAIVADPGRAETHNNYAILLKALGRLDEARASYTRAVAYAPDDPGVHSNLLMCLGYDPAMTAAKLVAEHRAWARCHAPAAPAPVFDPPAGGALRVGYVSPDFHEHSVAYFLKSVFRHHNPSRIALYAYSDVATPDTITAALRGFAGEWRDTRTDSDAALYDRIRADGIQVLVDLTGHTGRNRLPVFARRAAPVQITWLGYGATTGLPQMDYRLTDDLADPAGAEAWWTEALWRLPGGFLCYAPPESPLPESAAKDHVTFGSFNNLSKMNPAVIALWARVLNAVPDSRLLLKARQLADSDVGQRIRDAFAGHGVDPSHLDFAARTASRDDHLALYGAVDIALDTFPYNGATTSCEALWMGTPVVTLAGDRSTARYGASLLTHAGCGEWVAASPDQFVAIAAALARRRPDRAALRDRLALSGLTDGARAARELEAAYESMWRRWLETQ
ncbi:MAG: tetratricopeptide repeat protein [Alphaproteobacteria bacterium]